MVFNFQMFVEAYQNGDAVMVEFGYKRFAPVWQMLGQHKYVERHWHQCETLCSFFNSARLQGFVPRFAEDTGKKLTAQDENLEIWNSFFARFPMVKKLMSFVWQGLYVGLARRCMNFIEMFCRVEAKEKPDVHMEGVAPSITPEK